MSTTKLYHNNVYLKKSTATVVDIQPGKNDSIQLQLDQTIFFPQGGGQSCDLGTINDYSVLDVQEKNGEVIHTVAAFPSSMSIGDKVTCLLDWERRFDNMQRHCGEHILSGMFHREYGGVNRGFHMGEDYMTIDISLEDDPAYNILDLKMCLHVEECTNKAIWENLPVITRRFETGEEAKKLPLRKALAIDEEISIVCVGDISNPSDCVACCGTHPDTSGQVGLVKIFKVEKNKDMFRVYFEAGKRAMEDYDEKHSILTDLGNHFSAGTHDLIKKITATEEKNAIIKEQLFKLRRHLIEEKILTIAASSEHIFSLDFLSVDDAMRIGKNNDKPLLVLWVKEEKTLLLFSNGDFHCGDFIKAHNLKGGGKDKMARAIVPPANINEILEVLNNCF